jgi:hypothetical protein
MEHEPDWRTAKEVDQRWEMRRLRADVERSDMFGIYAHLGTMKRLRETSGPRGLRLRRRDEQALIRPYVDQQLRWEENRKKNEKCGVYRLAKSNKAKARLDRPARANVYLNAIRECGQAKSLRYTKVHFPASEWCASRKLIGMCLEAVSIQFQRSQSRFLAGKMRTILMHNLLI